MRDIIEDAFGITFTRFAEHDGDSETFEAVTANGQLIRADSLTLLLSAAQDASHLPAVLPAWGMAA